MNKSDLVETLSEGEDLTKTKAEEVVNLVFAEMTNALADGERVEVRGLFQRGSLVSSIFRIKPPFK